MKKLLLLGDYVQYSYHPLHAVEKELISILEEAFQITVCAEYAELTLGDLQQYDVILDYIDGWSRCGNSSLAAAMLQYVAQGGSIFALHNGIIKRTHPDLEQLYGARQAGHPARTTLHYVFTSTSLVYEGLEPFDLFEEPYMFTMDPIADVAKFLSYHWEDPDFPAGWTRLYGNGKVAVLSPGHDASVLQNTDLRRLIQRLAQWCANEI